MKKRKWLQLCQLSWVSLLNFIYSYFKNQSDMGPWLNISMTWMDSEWKEKVPCHISLLLKSCSPEGNSCKFFYHEIKQIQKHTHKQRQRLTNHHKVNILAILVSYTVGWCQKPLHVPHLHHKPISKRDIYPDFKGTISFHSFIALSPEHSSLDLGCPVWGLRATCCYRGLEMWLV